MGVKRLEDHGWIDFRPGERRSARLNAVLARSVEGSHSESESTVQTTVEPPLHKDLRPPTLLPPTPNTTPPTPTTTSTTTHHAEEQGKGMFHALSEGLPRHFLQRLTPKPHGAFCVWAMRRLLSHATMHLLTRLPGR